VEVPGVEPGSGVKTLETSTCVVRSYYFDPPQPTGQAVNGSIAVWVRRTTLHPVVRLAWLWRRSQQPRQAGIEENALRLITQRVRSCCLHL